MNSPTTLKMAAFQVVCVLANELIEALMSKVSLMTRREMKKEIGHLELIQTAQLKPYDYLYYAFDDSSEFDDDLFCGDETETDEEMMVILKRQKPTFTLFSFTDPILKLIQAFNYTKAFELVSKHASRLNILKHYWATNFTALDNSGFCGFIHQDVKFALACHARYTHNNIESLAELVREHMATAFNCRWLGLHFLEGYDLSQPFHDIYPFPPVVRTHGNFRSRVEVEWLKYLTLTQMCFRCNTTSCCGAEVGIFAECSHKKGCPFSLWIHRLYTFQEVSTVFELTRSCMSDHIQNLGHNDYECNLRLDTSLFNVNSAGGALYNGRGGWGGYKMEVIIKYSNLARFNVYFDQHGLRESYFDMIERAGLGRLCSLCSIHECTNFGGCVHANHYTSSLRRHQPIRYDDRPRQNTRTQSVRELREKFCRMTCTDYSLFTTDHKIQVFRGDQTIDVAVVQEDN